MGCYERLLRLLKSTGLYRLDGKSAVEAEMRLYAQYLDFFAESIGLLLDNCFMDTISYIDYNNWRRLYSLPAGMNWKDAKAIISRRLLLTNRDFTREGIQKCMAAGGFDAALTESFDSGQVTVTIRGDKGAFGTQAESESFLTGCLPCHVKPVFVWESA